MNKSVFNKKYSISLYRMLSSTEHSTGLSNINLKETKIGYHKNNEHANLMLTISTLLLCRLIIKLKEEIKAIEIKYNTLSRNITDRIEFYSNLLIHLTQPMPNMR